MGIIIWLIVGGIVGWLASLIMKRDAQQGIILNIVVGIVGSFLGGFLIAPMLGSGTANSGSDGVALTRSTSRSAMFACGSAGITAGTSNWTALMGGNSFGTGWRRA